MADQIWTDNASGNILINDQLNWDDGISGTPTANTDTAIFNGTWVSDASVNVAWTCGAITLDTGYTGDVDQGANTIIDDAGGESGDFTITAGEWNVSTYNLDVDGLTTVTDTLVMGTSADTGLTTIGFSVGSGATLAGQTDSKINNSGDYVISGGGRLSTQERFTYVQTANGNYTNVGYNHWYSFTIDAGVTLTPQVTGQYLYNTNLVNNGTLAIGSLNIILYCNSSMTLGTNSDFTGSGTLTFNLFNTTSFTNNKTGAFSLTGTVDTYLLIDNSPMPTGDWSKADYQVRGRSGFDRTGIFSSGTLKSKKFSITQSSTNQVTVTNSTNSPSFEWSDDVSLNSGAGSYTTVWNKDDGTITLTTGDATTKSINFDTQVIEDLIINTSEALDIKQLIEDVATDALTITSGTLDLNGQTLASSGAVIVTDTLDDSGAGATLTGTTFTSGASSTIDLHADTIMSFTGNVALDVNGTYTSNKGKWLLTGTSGTQTIDFNSRTLTSLTLNCTGATKQLTNTGIFYVGSLTITAGILDMNGKLLQSTGAVLVNGTLNDVLGSSLSGTTFTSGATSSVTLGDTTAFSFSSTIAINAGTTYTASKGAWTLTGGNANIGFGGKNILSLTLNCTGTKTLNAGVTADTVTFTAGAINLNSQTLSTGGNVALTSACTFGTSGTIEMTGASKTFDLDSTDQSIMSVSVAAGASITFQNGAITGQALAVEGTANFSVDDDTTVFTDISGAGTISCAAGTKYIYYTGTDSFTGTPNNVIIVQYGTNIRNNYLSIAGKLRVRL